jgi:hypothetical protein
LQVELNQKIRDYIHRKRQVKVKFQSTQIYLRGNVPMSAIKINELKINKPAEMIDFKKEAEQGNSEAFAAFTTLRGGQMVCCCWRPL